MRGSAFHLLFMQIGALTVAVTLGAGIEPSHHGEKNRDRDENSDKHFNAIIHLRAVDLPFGALEVLPRLALRFPIFMSE